MQSPRKDEMGPESIPAGFRVGKEATPAQVSCMSPCGNELAAASGSPEGTQDTARRIPDLDTVALGFLREFFETLDGLDRRAHEAEGGQRVGASSAPLGVTPRLETGELLQVTGAGGGPSSVAHKKTSEGRRPEAPQQRDADAA